MSRIDTRRLECGMDLIVESLPQVRSAGLTWFVSGGSAREPADKEGLGAMWSELLFRGAGGRGSRQCADAMDRLGVSRSAHVQTFFMAIDGVTLGRRAADALPLFVDMVRKPTMAPASIEPVRDLCVQAIEALADDPHDRVMLLARRKHMPEPINRSGMGRLETLRSISRDDLVGEWARLARPVGSVIALAGAVDADAIEDRLNELLADWSGQATEATWGESASRGGHHLPDETNQAHIAVMHDAPKEASEDSLLERVVTSVLSGGMSGRLFTEVREKRGLVYSVNAGYAASRDFGAVTAYAGTTPDKAPETLDVLVGELRRINGPTSAGGGIRRDEFDRAVVGMKSRLVMSGESTSARASALATDWFRIGRPRSLEEVEASIDAVTFERVNDYLSRRSLGEITVATIGPEPLGTTEFSHQL